MLLRRLTIPSWVTTAIAWVFLVGGLVGFFLSAFRIIGQDEPLLVLLLSWAALVYEGFNAVAIQKQSDSS